MIKQVKNIKKRKRKTFTNSHASSCITLSTAKLSVNLNLLKDTNCCYKDSQTCMDEKNTNLYKWMNT